MTAGAIIEVAVAAVLLVAGILLYRRKAPDDGGYGSQGAVIVFVVGLILCIHGFGLLEYRPSPMELQQ
jgi:multisubunit Na+/H+ antiporter MnhB subunit